jgi:hypothetical protein
MPTLTETRAQWTAPPVRMDAPEPTHRPHCYNRPPYAIAERGQWEPRQGYHETLHWQLMGLAQERSRYRWDGERWQLSRTGKPRYRWRRWFSTDVCRAWDCPPDELPTPARDRWDCRGCRWLPERGRVQYGSVWA